MWHHFHNVWTLPPLAGMPGPRTTNHAEGYHSDLHHDFGQIHPTLNNFLHWLQGANNGTNLRVQQLLHPTQPHMPHVRDPRYVEVDFKINLAKQLFLQTLTIVPAGQHVVLFNEVEVYLNYVIHLLGQV